MRAFGWHILGFEIDLSHLLGVPLKFYDEHPCPKKLEAPPPPPSQGFSVVEQSSVSFKFNPRKHMTKNVARRHWGGGGGGGTKSDPTPLLSTSFIIPPDGRRGVCVCVCDGGGGWGRKVPAPITSLIFKQYLPNVATFTRIYWGTRFWKNFASITFSTPCLLKFWLF